MQQIKVSPDGHFFTDEKGEPFFYIADTAWMLFNKLKEDEVRLLFEDRRKKGFSGIHSVIFRDLFTPNTSNAYGVKPFATEKDMYAVKMNREWIEYVRKIVKLAGEMGLYMGLLPTWGDKWNDHSNSAGPIIMNAESARNYGRFLSDELADCKNVIWILGGDSPTQTQEYADIVHAISEGVRSGGSSDKLISFHPNGSSSSMQFHASGWLDFNAIQSGHMQVNLPDYTHIETLYKMNPPKPCMNIEPNYEKCPMFTARKQQGEVPAIPLFSAYDVRKCLYRSILAGGAGFTYGCDPIRQIHREGDRIHVHNNWKDMPTWKEALGAPASGQLQHLARILTERSYFTRKPAQELLLPNRTMRQDLEVGSVTNCNEHPAAHIRVAACSEGSYILAYCPVRQVVCLDTRRMASDMLKVSLINPETGKSECTYQIENPETLNVIPLRDTDTLIVVDAVK